MYKSVLVMKTSILLCFDDNVYIFKHWFKLSRHKRTVKTISLKQQNKFPPY